MLNESNSNDYVHAKLLKGCKCSKMCFKRLTVTATEIYIHHLNVTEMPKSERDMLIMMMIDLTASNSGCIAKKNHIQVPQY